MSTTAPEPKAAKLFNRHIDLEISGYDAEAVSALAHELETLLARHTDKWHGNGKFKKILGLQTRSYQTRGQFTHWLDAKRAKENKGQ